MGWGMYVQHKDTTTSPNGSVEFGVLATGDTQFDDFLTVHHSIDLFQITNLMHNSFIL